MKKLIAALASAALITAPMAALAQGHGGGHGGGGHGFGGFHGGGFHGGGFHGGGFRGGFGGPFFWGAGFGLGLGLAYDPWFWGYPPYGYYGYYGYPAYYEYDYNDDAPAGSSSYYRGSMPSDDGAPPQGANARIAPPSQQSQAPAQACGSWRWDQTAQKYQWATDGC